MKTSEVLADLIEILDRADVDANEVHNLLPTGNHGVPSAFVSPSALRKVAQDRHTEPQLRYVHHDWAEWFIGVDGCDVWTSLILIDHSPEQSAAVEQWCSVTSRKVAP